MNQSQDQELAFQRKDTTEDVPFSDVWPSETAGNGQPVSNNTHTGAAQGKPSIFRKVKCRQCGYPMDAARNDHSGGSLDGNGAGGSVSTATNSYTPSGGGTASDPGGTQTYRQGAGCPLCFSKNSAQDRIILDQQINTPDRLPPLGF